MNGINGRKNGPILLVIQMKSNMPGTRGPGYSNYDRYNLPTFKISQSF